MARLFEFEHTLYLFINKLSKHYLGESAGGKDACSGDSGGPFTRTM